MTSITDLATKIEAAKLAGGGIVLSADELDGLLRIKNLFVSEAVDLTGISAPVGDEDVVITIEEVCSLLRTTRQTLYRWRRDGKFTPEPINSQGTRWLRSEVLEWRRARKA